MTILHLHPASGPLDLDMSVVEAALTAYWGRPRGTDLARQGPDYYDAASSYPGGDAHAGSGGVVTGPGSADPHHVVFGDLAWAVLLAGQPRGGAAQSLLGAAPLPVELPDRVPLAGAGDAVVDLLADTVWAVKSELFGVGVAIAVKMLHRKCPSLLPVVDNQNYFGSYADPRWRPGHVARSKPPSRNELRNGLLEVRRVVGGSENAAAWARLDRWLSPDQAGPFPRTVLFDMIWWAVRTRPSVLG